MCDKVAAAKVLDLTNIWEDQTKILKLDFIC